MAELSIWLVSEPSRAIDFVDGMLSMSHLGARQRLGRARVLGQINCRVRPHFLMPKGSCKGSAGIHLEFMVNWLMLHHIRQNILWSGRSADVSPVITPYIGCQHLPYHERVQIFVCDHLAMAAFDMGAKVVCPRPNFVFISTGLECTAISMSVGGFSRMDTSFVTIKVVGCAKATNPSTTWDITDVRLSVPLLVLSGEEY